VRSHVLAVGLHGRHSIRSRFGTQGRLVEVDNKDFRVRVNDDLSLPLSRISGRISVGIDAKPST